MTTPELIPSEEIRLSNGIPVLLQPYEGPVAATYWWNQVGSVDESPREAGFAHFLEHMLFKDASAKETGRASTGRLAQMIESLGGDINAYTSFDQTVYHVTCASQHWERVLDAFGEMAKPQRFLKQDFTREREVILEELRKNEDSPGRQLFQSLFSLTFIKHPYGRPVIGFVKTLKAAKLAELEAFYRRNYVSSKMGVILVGPLADPARRKKLIALAEKRFGGKIIKKAPGKRVAAKAEPELRSEIAREARQFDVKTPTLSFSFRVPDLAHVDTPALDVMAGVLTLGELSRIYQDLFYKTSLATDAGGGIYVPSDPGMLYVQAELARTDQIHPAAEELLRVLKRLRDEGPTREEIDRVVTVIESERLYATQSADGMAGRVGFLRFVVGDADYDRRYMEAIRLVDADRVREVARKYLDWRRMSVAALVPKDEPKYDLAAITELAKKELAPPQALVAAKARATNMAGPEVRLVELPSGMKVIYFERPQSHVFSIHASALGGLRLELTQPVDSAEKDWGSSHMMSMTWHKGTASRDAHQIASIVEGAAAGIDGFSGRNSVGLQMTGLARDWGRLSEVFSDVLVNPAFPEDEVNHSRRVAEDSIRSIEDHTSQVCSKLFLEGLFEHHPYGKLTLGSLESLAAIDSRKLKAFHRAWIRPERLVLAVSGPVRGGDIESWAGELEGALKSAVAGSPAPRAPAALQGESPLKAPRWVEKKLGREQAHVLIGGLGTRVLAEDRFQMRILQTLLGGQSGRLFIELREKKSLAYTVSPMSFEGIEPGYVGTYIACAPQKVQEAVEGIQRVLGELSKKGPTAREMARAKEFFLGRRAMDLQGDSALAAHFGLETLYGVPHLVEEEQARRIQSVTADQVREACRKYLVEPCMVTAIVG